VYGPLCNGATSLMFEGVPTYPDAGRFWHIIDKFKVTVFYTAPHRHSARSCVKGRRGRQSTKWIRCACSAGVGEPINPESVDLVLREDRPQEMPHVDTWWQTETGGILITPLPGAHTLKPGSANRPFLRRRPGCAS